MTLYHNKNPSWKGQRAKYKAFHEWLRNNYGSADKCENKKCKQWCKHFQWSLKRGKRHSHNRKSYQMLCISCHKKHDLNDKTRKNLSIAQKKVIRERDKFGRFKN